MELSPSMLKYVTECLLMVSDCIPTLSRFSISHFIMFTTPIFTSIGYTCARLEEAAFAQTAAQYENKGDVLLFEDEMPGDSLRKLCDAVASVCGGRCAVFAGTEGEYKYAIGHMAAIFAR